MNLSNFLCLSLISITPATALGKTLVLEPSQDNTIYEEGNLSNGAGIHLFAGLTKGKQSTGPRRALLKFDLSVIPAGATIDFAELQLQVNKTPPGVNESHDFSLHKLTQAWGEGSSDASGAEGRGTSAATGDATWNSAFFSDTSWTTSGGDFVEIASATEALGSTGSYQWTGEGLIADISEWISNPDINYGWILIGDESTPSARRFASRENSNEQNRPKLTITYSTLADDWNGFAYAADGRSVDTDSWLGWIDAGDSPWIWVYAISKYIYVPEQDIASAGGWTYIPK